MEGLEVTEEVVAPAAVRLSLRGSLDVNHAYGFDRRLLAAEGQRPEVLVVDLREVGFLDSSGLARLVAAHRRARRGGRRLVLLRGAGVVERVLAMTRLADHLEVVADLRAALRPV